jgi:hypothetical protein
LFFGVRFEDSNPASLQRTFNHRLDPSVLRAVDTAIVTTALIGIGAAILGVLVGGVVQLYVAHRERVAASRRAARLLFSDLWIGASAVRSLRDIEFWWAEEVKPPLEDWRRFREPLAGAMWGPDFQTVDGAFTRIADLERWRLAKAKPEDVADEARVTAEQAKEAAALLLRHGFSRREYKAAAREVESWPPELPDDPTDGRAPEIEPD